uniref:Uncharacterized protein n=1 Tax=Romanomermis culicivorax TaxID=13658 RepID=A0A915L3R8_ROMCU
MSSWESQPKEPSDVSCVLVLYIHFGLLMKIQLIRRNLLDVETDQYVASKIWFRMCHQRALQFTTLDFRMETSIVRIAVCKSSGEVTATQMLYIDGPIYLFFPGEEKPRVSIFKRP